MSKKKSKSITKTMGQEKSKTMSEEIAKTMSELTLGEEKSKTTSLENTKTMSEENTKTMEFLETMESEIDWIRKKFYELESKKALYYQSKEHMLYGKNLERSVNIRKEGNKLFGIKDHNVDLHKKLWHCYSCSIALALNGSEDLAAGYANRSALLLHLKKYKECVEDIDRALKITKLDSLKVKLLCRKTKCFVILQEDKHTSSLEKAKYWLNKINDTDKDKKKLIETVEKTEKFLESDIENCKEKPKKLEINCNNDSIYINYSEEYGRHLTAARDIQCGEIVCMEKFYASSINLKKSFTTCNHCLAISWTTIPCDNCTSMYCTENCKQEAWTKYHEFECLANINKNSYLSYYIQLSVRTLLMAIKEAGSIKELRSLVYDIEKCSDKLIKGHSKDGKFLSDSFRSVYSLSYSKCEIQSDAKAHAAVYALVGLAQRTTLFGKDFKYGDGKNFLQFEDVLFTGCLILRLMSIFAINAFNVVDPYNKCKKYDNPIMCLMQRCCSRGMIFSPLTSLINHKCNSNVAKFFNSDGKIIYYALQPIKKDSQIFSAYYYNYLQADKWVRQKLLHDMFEILCKCTACTKNWSDRTSLISLNKPNLFPKEKKPIQQIIEKNKRLIKSIMNKNFRCNKKTIQAFSKDVEQILDLSPQPSLSADLFLMALQILIETSYNDEFQIPKDCSNI